MITTWLEGIPDHARWLWVARLLLLLSTLAVFAGSNDVRTSTCYVITCICYATSAILKALAKS